MELYIIECKNCGLAYRGDITKPFLCPKCISDGVTLDDVVKVSEEAITANNTTDISNFNIKETDSLNNPEANKLEMSKIEGIKETEEIESLSKKDDIAEVISSLVSLCLDIAAELNKLKKLLL